MTCHKFFKTYTVSCLTWTLAPRTRYFLVFLITRFGLTFVMELILIMIGGNKTCTSQCREYLKVHFGFHQESRKWPEWASWLTHLWLLVCHYYKHGSRYSAVESWLKLRRCPQWRPWITPRELLDLQLLDFQLPVHWRPVCCELKGSNFSYTY